MGSEKLYNLHGFQRKKQRQDFQPGVPFLNYRNYQKRLPGNYVVGQ